MRLLAYFALASIAKKARKYKPTYDDCVSNGATVDDDSMQLQCDGKGKCDVKCDDGFKLLGVKKIKCKYDKKDQIHYVHPATKLPVCKRCEPLDNLLEPGVPEEEKQFKYELIAKSKKVKYSIRCRNEENILPSNEPCMIAECYCDKTAKSCYYRGKQKENIEAELASLSCQPKQITEPEATALLNSPSRLPKGLQCNLNSGNNTERIVGGIEAIQHSWPWIVQLQYGGKFHCSGTVVGERMIISAAHCCKLWKRIDLLKGVVAEHSLVISSEYDNSYEIGFEHLEIHPDYHNRKLANDICLLIPNVPLKFDYNEVAVPLTQPACLPAQGVEQQPEGTLCWTAGWGRLKWRGKLANVLQEVDVKLISDEQCMTLETAAIFNPTVSKCAGHVEGGKDACQGDSGGPLICAEDGRPVLRGITSAGIGCAQPNNAGVYTRIENYIGWIEFYNHNDIRTIRKIIKDLENSRHPFDTLNDIKLYMYQEISAGRDFD